MVLRAQEFVAYSSERLMYYPSAVLGLTDVGTEDSMYSIRFPV